MPRRARRYDIFLPLTSNSGKAIPKRKFGAVEERLVQRFGGLTAQRREFPLQGIWQGKTRLYVDEVIIMTVLDFHSHGSGRFIARLKSSLLEDFEQIEGSLNVRTLIGFSFHWEMMLTWATRQLTEAFPGCYALAWTRLNSDSRGVPLPRPPLESPYVPH